MTDRIFLDEIGETLESSYQINESGHRSVASRGDITQVARYRVAVFGCSYVFGLSVASGQTACDLLSLELEDTEIINLGVPGYSTYQALLLMQEFLATDRPDAIVFGLQANHDARNVLLRDEIKWFAGPWCRASDPRGAVATYPPSSYAYLPFSGTLHTVKALERLINLLYSIRSSWSREVGATTTRAVLLKMREVCDARGVPLLIVGLDTNHDHQCFLEREGFRYVQSAIDLRTSKGLRDWTNYRLDPTHPDHRAHAHYAEVIAPALRAIRQGLPTPQTSFFTTRSSSHDEVSDAIYPLF